MGIGALRDTFGAAKRVTFTENMLVDFGFPLNPGAILQICEVPSRNIQKCFVGLLHSDCR